jgi:hypothetical protein
MLNNGETSGRVMLCPTWYFNQGILAFLKYRSVPPLGNLHVVNPHDGSATVSMGTVVVLGSGMVMWWFDGSFRFSLW